jgi:O-antigen ligase
MNLTGRFVSDVKFRRIVDYLAIAVAISLPWSTSATTILMVIWMLAFLPTLNVADVRREIFTMAGGFPLLLVAWAALGMLWVDTTWAESFAGLRQFLKLLSIPVLLAYFRHSNSGMQVMAGFIVSCIALLALSLIISLWPEIYWGQSRGPGVPIKSYITQSAEFAGSAFCLFYLSIEAWKARAHTFSIITSLIAIAFIGDIVFIVTSRIELIVIAVLIILFGARLYGWKGLLLGVAALSFLCFIAWNTSSSLRAQIDKTEREIQSYRTDKEITSTGYHLEFLRKSISYIATAPMIGHGTGSIKPLFEQSAIGKTGVSGSVTSNPHNQIFAVAIQLGLIGAAILGVMWIAHVLMFLGPGIAAWFGLVLVMQIILGSFFNTHLFDFTEGWIYVCGVGVLGGTCGRDIELPFPRKWSDLKLFLVPPKIG